MFATFLAVATVMLVFSRWAPVILTWYPIQCQLAHHPQRRSLDRQKLPNLTRRLDVLQFVDALLVDRALFVCLLNRSFVATWFSRQGANRQKVGSSDYVV